MGRNPLDEDWSPEEKEIINRRGILSDGSRWPMSEWDYTEWEEFLQEINKS